MYLHRLLEKTIRKVRATFPVIVVTGPRQSGKSTLLKNFPLGKKPTHLSLEDSNLRSLIMEEPLAFLEKQPKPVVLDEIQNLPEIANFVKILVDRNRKPGAWFITGSQQFSVMKNISESLAGRAAVLALPPFQIQERTDLRRVQDFVFLSSYPELVVNKKVDQRIWYSSYLQTYLERDVRNILNITDLRDFEQLLRFLATRTGQELNYSVYSNELGISVPTVKRWISVLEASYIIFLLPPYFKNFGKRIIKSPKIYFYDIGLLNYLLGIKNGEQVLSHPLSGAIFETAVISEVMKRKYADGVKPELYHWRSQSGIEVDLIVSEKGRMNPYEIKLSSNIKPLFYKNLRYWLDLSGQRHGTGYLITNCSRDLPMPKNIKNIFWKDL